MSKLFKLVCALINFLDSLLSLIRPMACGFKYARHIISNLGSIFILTELHV